MKCLTLFVCMLSVVLVAASCFAETYEFVTKDGTSVFGELKDYNIDTDLVQIKTDQGKTVQSKASSFRNEDFIYIRDWDAVRRFADNNYFRIYLSFPISRNKWDKYAWRENPGKVQPSNIRIDHFERKGYELKFDNKTGYDLENVEIKYCLFYEQEILNHEIEKKEPHIICRPSIHKFAIVPDDLNKKWDSNSIVMREKEIAQAGSNLRYLRGDGRFLEHKFIGMIFRAKITTMSGQSTEREMRRPLDLSEEFVWVEPTEENTAWTDDDLDEKQDTYKPMTMFEKMGGREDDEE
jgi:hypothetical protein